MPIAIWIILALVLTAISTAIVVTDLHRNRNQEAIDLNDCMLDKFIELLKGPAVSRDELSSWMPLFESVDRIVKRNSNNIKLVPIATRLQKIIDERFPRNVGN